LRALQAMTFNAAGEIDQADAAARRALATAEAAGDRIAAGYALAALSTVSFHRRDNAAMLEYMDRGLALIETDPQATDLRLLLLVNRALELSDQERLAEAIDTARQGLALAERAGTPRVHLARYTLGMLHMDSGDWDDALAELEPATGVPGFHYVRLMNYGALAVVAGRRDDRETAARYLSDVEDSDISSGPALANSHLVRLARAIAAEQDGRPADAMAILAQCLEPGVAEGIPGVYLMVTPLIRLALAIGDRDIAEAAAGLAAAEADREPVPAKIVTADHCRGLMEGDPGPALAAEAHFLATRRPFERALALEDVAAMAAQRGDLDQAQGRLGDAMGIFSALGAAWDIRRAAVRFEAYGIRASRSAYRGRPATGWEALTPTEVKVAYLVAEGRSNPDVAAELFLSRNTVQTHVSHILAKLGARSRAEIIREALNQPRGTSRTLGKGQPQGKKLTKGA
jgi:DNA-binding CsgD family transcriptional regulator